MNEDKQELLMWIQERMRQKGGRNAQSFYRAVQEDPLLLKDFFQTFSEQKVVDAMLDENIHDSEHIGVWIRRRGESLPTYAEVSAGIDGAAEQGTDASSEFLS